MQGRPACFFAILQCGGSVCARVQRREARNPATIRGIWRCAGFDVWKGGSRLLHRLEPFRR